MLFPSCQKTIGPPTVRPTYVARPGVPLTLARNYLRCLGCNSADVCNIYRANTLKTSCILSLHHDTGVFRWTILYFVDFFFFLHGQVVS